ncbi:McbC-like oxidoreductase [Candidatus Sulfopaludibacter sp. SbA4]|nr:McbC-like oxidoreductase [Candidatus Sulfopaludibacter sp. SbA4]
MALEAIDNLLLTSDNNANWELFHENSKTSFVEPHPTFKLWPTDEVIVGHMNLLRRVKPFTDSPKIELPRQVPASTRSFDEVLFQRSTARGFAPQPIRLEQLAKVLIMSYGVNRSNEGTIFPRPFRVIPSGGALYPLEIFLHAGKVDGLAPGLYHYDPEDHNLDVLRDRDESDRILPLFVQQDLARNAAAILFIAAVFGRTVFKYGDRGYRFVLLEAGHLAQNANLTAREMGLTTTNIGGYADRGVDRYLGLDGLNESAIYLMLLGHPGKEEHTGHHGH